MKTKYVITIHRYEPRHISDSTYNVVFVQMWPEEREPRSRDTPGSGRDHVTRVVDGRSYVSAMNPRADATSGAMSSR